MSQVRASVVDMKKTRPDEPLGTTSVSAATRADLDLAVRRLAEAETARAQAAAALVRVRARGDGEAAVGMPVEQHLRWNVRARRGLASTLGIIADVAPELPTVTDALETGRITVDQAGAIAWPAARVSRDLRRSLAMALDEWDGWEQLDPETIELEARRLLEELQPALTEQQEADRQQAQWLHLQPTLDGQGLRGDFQAWGVHAAFIDETLNAASAAPDAGIGRSDGRLVGPTRRAHQLFDGLLRIFRGWTSTSSKGSQGASPNVTLLAIVDERDDATGTGELLTRRAGLAPA